MKSIKLEEYNKVYVGNRIKNQLKNQFEKQPEYLLEYLPLPVYENESKEDGGVVHCWKLSFVERLKVLFLGKIWIKVLNFENSSQPISSMAVVLRVYGSSEKCYLRKPFFND